MRKQQRKKLVVEPTIQYSLVRQLIGQWTVYLLASALLLSVLQVLLGGVFQPWEYHFSKIWPMVASQTTALLFLSPLFILSSLKLSNRFVGPIQRLRQQMRSIANGQPRETLRFRGEDFWTDIASELERAIDTVSRTAQNGEEVGPVVPQINQPNNSGIVLPNDDLLANDNVSSADTI